MKKRTVKKAAAKQGAIVPEGQEKVPEVAIAGEVKKSVPGAVKEESKEASKENVLPVLETFSESLKKTVAAPDAVYAEEPDNTETAKETVNNDKYQERFNRHVNELKWLYMELYNNDYMFDELCKNMYGFYQERKAALKNLDSKRELRQDWFKQSDMLGMMLYVDNFAGNLQGVKGKLDYIEKCNVNYVHLMPLLESPEGRSDGGYAVSDFRKVQENLGTMEDLSELAEECHKRDMSVCLDFVMNHTSEDHEWAVKARQGDGEYMSRYFFYDNYSIPAMF